MSTIKVITARENLIDEVIRHLFLEGKNLSTQAIVFPGKRPAHFLRKQIAEKFGSSYQPPQIYSIDEFIDTLVTRDTSPVPKKLSILDAVTILFDIHERKEYSLGKGVFRTFSQFLPIGIKAFHEFEELILADVEPVTFRSLMEAVPYGRMQALGQYYEEFYNVLQTQNYTTRALNYKRAALYVKHTPPEYTVLVLAGFHTLTPIEQKLFAALQQYKNVVLLFQKPSTDDQKEKSLPHNKFLDFLPSLSITRAPDLHGQMFALASILKNTNVPLDESTVVVLPTAQSLFPFLHSVIPVLGDVEYNIALGYPLVRTPLYGFLRKLLSVASTMNNEVISAPHYIKFLLHPYIKNIKYGTRTDITRILIQTLEESFVKNPSQRTFTLEQIEHETSLFQILEDRLKPLEPSITKDQICDHLQTIHNNTIKKVLCIQKQCSLGTLAEQLIEVLTFIHDSSAAKLHPFFNIYVDALIAELELLITSFVAPRTFSTPDEYTKFLHTYLINCSVPFPGTPLRGVQVLGLLETRNIQFRTVFLLDANEGSLPPISDPPLIPHHVRIQLGLETNKEREELIAHYLRLLLQGAEHVHLFFSETHSGKKERSRYITKILWQIEQQKQQVCEQSLIQNVRYQLRLSTQPPQSLPKTLEMSEQLKASFFTATMLDTYLHCQLRFYYHYVLGLQEHETVFSDFEEKDIGIVVHRILQRMYKPFINTPLTPEKLQHLDLDMLVTVTLQEQFGSPIQGRLTLIQRQLRTQLKEYIEAYQLPLLRKHQITILGLEQVCSFSHSGVLFSSKIDRIEQRTNTIYILDYKTSSNVTNYKINFSRVDPSERASWSKAIGSLQLPLYTMLYSTLSTIPSTAIVAGYIFLGRTKLNENCEISLYDSNDQALKWQPILENIILSLVKEICDPNVPFTPTENFKNHCPWCPFTILCGTQWIA
ncbi:MAG: PD-(D/E)XK nuclease family protein [Bacteroidetes bacterium]|nr:PD-(D/E)XK nuclease family protein [Bacteroidota bacterium]